MIRRTYQCPNCDKIFTVQCESNAPDPACPNPDCDKVLEWRPQSFAIGGSVEGKAVALTQNILENDYGLSNFKDNTRAGDNSIIQRQETRAEADKVEREFHEQMAQVDQSKSNAFWGSSSGQATGLHTMTGQSLIAMAKHGPAAADPIALLNQGVKSGKIPTLRQMTRIEGRADAPNPARKAGV